MQSSLSRAGKLLFSVYLALYLGFVLLNAFWPEKTEATPWAGVNVAILYGFGLIIVAIVLAVVYGFVSRGQGGGAAAGDEAE